MSLLVHALWLLCGIGAVVFAATSIRDRWSIIAAAAGLALGAIVARPVLPDASGIAVLAGLVAIVGLAWPRHWLLIGFSAGVFAGFWSALLQLQGAPLTASVLIAAALPALSAWLTYRRPGIAPPRLRDGALLVTLVVALAVAIAIGIADGWRGALALNVSVGQAQPGLPAWMLGLAAASA